MGNCHSSPSPDSSTFPRTGGDPQQHQPKPHRPEPRLDESLSLSLQGRDATPEPAKPVKPGGSNHASTPFQPNGKPFRKPHRSNTANPPSPLLPLRTPTLAYTPFDMGSPITGEEANQKPLHKHGRSKSLFSSTSGQGPVHGYRRQNRFDSAPEPRSARRAAMRGNKARSFPSKVREVLPDGFR